MKTEIKLIENKELGTFRVTVNGIDMYEPFTDEINAKAAAFDQSIQVCNTNGVLISYHSF